MTNVQHLQPCLSTNVAYTYWFFLIRLIDFLVCPVSGKLPFCNEHSNFKKSRTAIWRNLRPAGLRKSGEIDDVKNVEKNWNKIFEFLLESIFIICFLFHSLHVTKNGFKLFLFSEMAKTKDLPRLTTTKNFWNIDDRKCHEGQWPFCLSCFSARTS